MGQFKNIALVGKYPSLEDAKHIHDQLNVLVDYLKKNNHQIFIESKTQQQAKLEGVESIALNDLTQHADLVIVIGGDGTMLGVARSVVDANIPLVGINQGRFGFLADLNIDSMLKNVELILKGDFLEDKRILLQADIIRSKAKIYDSFALNDVVVKSSLRLIELEVYIDNKFVHRQRSDGIITSTPTGATAYALSAGGPILHPSLDAISIVPINPHTLSNRPIAVNGNSSIEIKIIHLDDAYVSIDGQIKFPLDLRDVIKIQKSKQTVSILHPKDYCYFEMLRNKLHWG
ncbi:MAG: NAD(+) kinase [Methylophilaceae bacterium]|jgi:NAD+ kinase